MVYREIISNSKHTHGADLNIKRKASDLRKNMTSVEKILWEHLRCRKLEGMYFRRQHPYGIYIIDFFCSKANLAVEIDGGIHKSKTKSDLERTNYLEATGLKVIRFKNKDVKEHINEVLLNIKK